MLNLIVAGQDTNPARLIMPVGVGLFLTLGMGPNFELALLSCVVLIIGTFVLWRPGEPPVLLYMFLFQWFQASVLMFYCNVLQISMNDWSSRDAQRAVILSIVGVAIFALGLRAGSGPLVQRQISGVQYLFSFGQPRWARVYLAAWVLATTAQTLALAMPGLSQPLLALAGAKWAAFLIFTIVTFSVPGSSRLIWFSFFVVEVVLSLGGYFANFKTVFLFTLFGIAASGIRLSVRQVSGISFFSILLIVFALYWTAIKPEYRYYVSGSEADQSVNVEFTDAVEKVFELVLAVEVSDLNRVTEELMFRFSEIDHLSLVLEHVPAVMPHEHGNIWWDAITRPFMPRLFFSSKTIIDESELTRKFTGVNVSGSEAGTQISLGYAAESYIDFGEYGMMLAIFLFSLFLGYTYRLLSYNPNSYGMIGTSLAAATLVQIESIALSSAKAFGGVVVCIIVFLPILKFVVPYYTKRVSP